MSGPLLGWLRNATSRDGHLADDPLLRALADHPDVLLAVRRQGEDSGPLLARMVDAGVRAIVIDGGDGTVMHALTHLLGEIPAEARPPVAIVPGGTANVTAASFGLPRTSATLDALLAAARMGAVPTREVHLLRVAGGGLPRARRCFVLGGAAVAQAVRLWKEHLRTRGFVGELSHAAVLGWLVLRLALSGPARAGLDAVEVAVRLDAADWGRRPRLALLATTLERLVLGAAPFWDRDGRPMGLTCVDAGAPGLLVRLPRLLRGGRGPWPEGYRSGGGERATITGLAEVVLDGEIVRTDPADPLLLDATETVRLVRLPAHLAADRRRPA